MSTPTIFLGGLPTGPDIAKLVDAYGIPAVGDRIEWKQIEGVLGLKRTEHRFKTIVGQWRRKLYRDHNVVLAPGDDMRGIGLEALNPEKRINLAAAGFKAGARKINRASELAVRTDQKELPAPLVQLAGRIANMNAQFRLLNATKPKELPPIT